MPRFACGGKPDRSTFICYLFGLGDEIVFAISRPANLIPDAIARIGFLDVV
ncbi:hypothetical protein RBSH_04308 [Rhodopirellula baltica SH28]|uniref:Uncharacterized protein n=4 Tax=Rhodopirellula baltica TaxID=265606 RepID=Q7UH49_RHOBA|nr:hypothetical protein RBWH47_04963 [Rhodopirellula baltica WH47]EKK00359.1 hypothetical protein RBSH_04308 [Rhodopirellula baltica SH28]ELP35741.1 hypothetical protein RBSWK_00309 [Rhodopirellula baltica SWK14]CAD78130.1 hypothetical protein RB4844 [Rhodopirellula baltica SH 1]